MKMEIRGDTLHISNLPALGAFDTPRFRQEIRATRQAGPLNIDLDLSQTSFIDSAGLGALLSLHQAASRQNGRLRLLHPPLPVQQMLELTRLHRVLHIVLAE